MVAKRFRKPPGFSGWRYEIENRAAILARSLPKYAEWKQNLKDYPWEPAPEIDPRDWFKMESQGSLGSCQGNALASCTEYAYLLKYGPQIELSRMWAYLVSQEEDGISGDSGSTLEGGGAAASSRGLCLESSFPYPNSYSAGRSFYNANKAKLAPEALNYKLMGEVPLATWDDCVLFLKSRTGSIQTGLMWSTSCDVEWEQKSYSPGNGGHSTVLCGYLKVDGWPDGIGLLHKNSWGTDWGRGGWTLIHKNAIEAMLKARNNLFIGRTESESPIPTPKPDL